MVFPDLRGDEFIERLGTFFEARGRRVLDRIEHPCGAPLLGRHASLDGHPGARAFTFFEPEWVDYAGPMTIVHERLAGDAPWDPTWIAGVSAEAGGWALAWKTGSGVGGELIAYLGGCRVERVTTPGEAGTRAVLAGWMRQVSDAPCDLDPAATARVRSIIVSGLAISPRDSARGDSELHRAVISDVELTQVLATAAELSAQPEARWAARRSPTAKMPFVVVDGVRAGAWLSDLARSLDASVASVTIGATGVSWATHPPGTSGASGEGRGVETVARALGCVTIAMGDYPAIVRGPGSELTPREAPRPSLRPLLLVESVPGTWSLLLDAESDAVTVEGVIAQSGEAPTGYLWTRVARALVDRNEPALREAIEYASEAGAFSARSDDAVALERLGVWMSWVASDPDAMRTLLAKGV